MEKNLMKNGHKYTNNYERASAYFISTCALRSNIKERSEAYDFITNIYQTITNPSLIGLKAYPDVYFEPWEQQSERQKDVKIIRDSIKKIEEIIKNLFDICEKSEINENGLLLNSDIKINFTLKKILNVMNIEIENNSLIHITKECAVGLKELANISRQNTIHITDGPLEDKAYLFFSRVVYDVNSDWLVNDFDNMLNANGSLIWLTNRLEERGYKRIYCRDGKKMSLDYVKNHGKKDEPLKMAWAERSHTGIEVSYEDLRLEPIFLWIRMPMFKTVLENVEELPVDVVDFIERNTKTCNGCRYCVQTDKTKTKPLASIKVNNKRKCPLFPGFTMNTRQLSNEQANNIIQLLDAIDCLLERKLK